MRSCTLLAIAAGAQLAHGSLLWAAHFANATDSSQAGFGNIQIQYGGGNVENNGPEIPVFTHPQLGRALNISLGNNEERWEAAPGAGSNLGEGQTVYVGVNFVLGNDFNIAQSDSFCLLNQIHQASGSGSPPIEFDVHNNALWVRGASTAYNKQLLSVSHGTVYNLIYGVTLSATASKSLLNVWVNGNQVLTNFVPPNPFLVGGNSYWKGATMYCDVSIQRPLEVYQNAHRIGTTYADVANSS